VQVERAHELDESDPFVAFKLRLLRSAMPAADAIVFGDMYIVEGAYARKCIDLGCKRALLVDTLESTGWLEGRLRYPTLDFRKGDFANPLFMRSFSEQYDIGIAFDILLHQAPLVSTINLMLEKVREKFVIVQPVLEEQALPNSLVFLPGNTAVEDLHPTWGETHIFDLDQVNHSHWLWGITPSFLRSLLASEGLEIVEEERLYDLPNPRWSIWGCVAQRTSEKPAAHWSNHVLTHELYPGWRAAEPATAT
jgi:hypothetical protein